MKQYWWKYLASLLVAYALIGGLAINVPEDVGMLDQTIRNLFYHVPMWFAMMLMLFSSWILSILYLNKQLAHYDRWASSLANVALVAGTCGIFTGMLWASSTWGTPWTRDPKLNGAAVGILMYIAYWVLRKSIPEIEKKRRIAAVYNVFIFPAYFAMIWIVPKLSSFSIHPGSGDTVGFGTYDLDGNMRFVFYPAVIGWTLLFVWIAEIRVRIKKLNSSSPLYYEENIL